VQSLCPSSVLTQFLPHKKGRNLCSELHFIFEIPNWQDILK